MYHLLNLIQEHFQTCLVKHMSQQVSPMQNIVHKFLLKHYFSSTAWSLIFFIFSFVWKWVRLSKNCVYIKSKKSDKMHTEFFINIVSLSILKLYTKKNMFTIMVLSWRLISIFYFSVWWNLRLCCAEFKDYIWLI